MSDISLETDSSFPVEWSDWISDLSDSLYSPTAMKTSEVAFFLSCLLGGLAGVPRKKRPISALPLASGDLVPPMESPVLPPPPTTAKRIPATLSPISPLLPPTEGRTPTNISPLIPSFPPPPPPTVKSTLSTPPLLLQTVQSVPYELLRRTKEDEDQIAEIVTSIGKCSAGKISFVNFGWTAFKKFPGYDTQMNGPEGKELHPFKFLAIIFTNPNLRKYMPGIFQNPSSTVQNFLRNRFMEGVNRGMEREAKREKLTPYLEPFAAEVGVSVDALKPLIQNRSWEQLVRLLIGEGGGPREQTSRASQS